MSEPTAEFETASAPAEELFIIVLNHNYTHTQCPGALPVPETSPLHSGVSEESFAQVMLEFAYNEGKEIWVVGQGYVIMSADEDTLQAIQEQCGPRFSYKLVDHQGLEEFNAALRANATANRVDPVVAEFARTPITRYQQGAERPFIVVSNHKRIKDETGDPHYALVYRLGIIMEEVAAKISAHLVMNTDDFAVLEGDENLMAKLEKRFGDCFSYSRASKCEVGQLAMLAEGMSVEEVIEFQARQRIKMQARAEQHPLFPHLLPAPYLDA